MISKLPQYLVVHNRYLFFHFSLFLQAKFFSVSLERVNLPMPTNQRNRLHTNKGYGMIICVPIKKISIIYRKDTNNAAAGHF